MQRKTESQQSFRKDGLLRTFLRDNVAAEHLSNQRGRYATKRGSKQSSIGGVSPKSVAIFLLVWQRQKEDTALFSGNAPL